MKTVTTCLCLALWQSALAGPALPAWPAQFSATLYKIGPLVDATPAQWMKLWYKYVPPRFSVQNSDPHNGGGYARFDFYNHYLNLANEWQPECSIYFHSNAIYFALPNGECDQVHDGIGNIAPDWMRDAFYNGSIDFRGLKAEQWIIPNDAPEDVIHYYVRRHHGVPVPMRSTNQADDPGGTDYFDHLVADQPMSVFQLPEKCQCRECWTDVSCPLEQVGKFFNLN